MLWKNNFKKWLYYDNKTLCTSCHNFLTRVFLLTNGKWGNIHSTYWAVFKRYFPFLNTVLPFFFQTNISMPVFSTTSAEYLWSQAHSLCSGLQDHFEFHRSRNMFSQKLNNYRLAYLDFTCEAPISFWLVFPPPKGFFLFREEVKLRFFL